MKTLVTGGAGFIGSHIVDALLARGDEVVVLDSLATGRRENIAHVLDRIHFVEKDLRDPAAVTDAVRGCDFVLHEAALASVPRSFEIPCEYYDTNVNGMYLLLEQCVKAGVKRFVWASSSSVYGDTKALPQKEGCEEACLSPYALTKKAGEDIARMFNATFGLETVTLRYFNVFGPRQRPDSQYAAVIPKFIDAMKKNMQPVIFGDGEQTRDFTYVANVVDANLKALSAPKENAAGRTFNIALGKPVSVNILAEIIAKYAGSSLKPSYAPARRGDILHSYADISMAKKSLGIEEKVPLEEGIRLTVDSFK